MDVGAKKSVPSDSGHIVIPLYREFLEEGAQIGMRYTLNIPRDAMQGSVGIQSGRSAGNSIDFRDYREYQIGDDLRRIDWGVFARSDDLIVKLYRDEVCPHLDIVLDCSQSMGLVNSEKPHALLGLAGLFASASANVQCSHAAWMIADGVIPVTNSSSPSMTWEGISIESRLSPLESYAVMPPKWQRHGIRVFLSDLLISDDPLQVLRPMAENAAALTVIQLLAEADVNPMIRGNTRLLDVETGETLEVFVDAFAAKHHHDAMIRHQQNWQRACRQVGALFTTIVAERTVGEKWQLDSLRQAQILGAA